MTKQHPSPTPRPILVVCLPCGREHDRKHKEVIGMWRDTCDLCGEENVSCASAPHDFGLYGDQESKAKDAVDDRI